MKINLSKDGNELSLEATDFKEARLLAILSQRISNLRSATEHYTGAWPDDVSLYDTGRSLKMVWTIGSDEEAE